MHDFPPAAEASGAFTNLVAACEAYAQIQGASTARASQGALMFQGCAYPDGTFDIGVDAYLGAISQNLQQQRRAASRRGPSPRRLAFTVSHRSAPCPRCADGADHGPCTSDDNPPWLYAMEAVGHDKHKQRQKLLAASKRFSAYVHQSTHVLFEGCIWPNGDFATGFEAFYVAKMLQQWQHAATLPKSERPRPFRKIKSSAP